jgi:hypothetical protein
LIRNSWYLSAVTLTGLVSHVPAGQLMEPFCARTLSTKGQIPIFSSKVHSPSALYHGLASADVVPLYVSHESQGLCPFQIDQLD